MSEMNLRLQDRGYDMAGQGCGTPQEAAMSEYEAMLGRLACGNHLHHESHMDSPGTELEVPGLEVSKYIVRVIVFRCSVLAIQSV
jgi:hypothetical protein